MPSILVTGGAGFIGANFVHYWLDAFPGRPVVVLDALTYAGNRANLRGLEGRAGYQFVHGDICDEALVQALLARHHVTLVAHFAAESHVDRSITGPDEFVRTNVVGTHTLLKCATRAWRTATGWQPDVLFHHVSTDEVYGSLRAGDPAFTEDSPMAPSSPYAASKAASDHLVRAYHHTYGLPVTISNCSNCYGPYQFPEKLIPLMLVRALRGEPMPVYARGENVRDWLHVSDHCRGVALIIDKGRRGVRYNIGAANEWRNIDVVRLLAALVDARLAASADLRSRFPACPASRGQRVEDLIQFVPDRAGHDWRYALDTGRIRSELGYRPEESFATGIAHTVDWYLDNERWWQGILDGSYRNGGEPPVHAQGFPGFKQ